MNLSNDVMITIENDGDNGSIWIIYQELMRVLFSYKLDITKDMEL